MEFPYYEEAAKYFYKGNRDKDNIVYMVTNEVYHRTGDGEKIYLALNELMFDHEFNHEHNKEDLNERIKEIIGVDNPNNTLD